MATSRLNGKSGENSPHLLGNIEEGNGKKTNAEIPPSPYKEDEKRKNLEEKKIKVLSTRRPRCQGPAPVLGGIAPLLLPNPFMPSGIRLAHGFEVGISNFLFGMIVGAALASKPRGNG